MTTALLLVDHGSRRAEANANLEAVAALVRAEAPSLLVEIAHMELAPPSIEEAMSACVDRGAARIVVVPYFLGPGRHATHDIPALAQAAARKLGVEAEVAPPLGVHPLLARLVLHRAGVLDADATEV